MKIIYFFIISSINSFQFKPINRLKLKLYNKPDNNKFNSFLKLIRYKNIIPTIFLNFSGGWIVNPSINNIFSISFIVTIINTILIMSTSMILNDLYDINIDKINNPLRPLVTKSITINEAYILIIYFLFLTEILSFNYLNNNLIMITQLSIINILLYTPIFKKITFIKNLSCASLISFAPIYSGLSLGTNNNLLYILSGIIFLGSLFNEILLDISDFDGDKDHNIYTIPVVFGKNKSYYLLVYILFTNFLFCLYNITEMYNIMYGITLPVLLIPFFIDLDRIKKSNYSDENIRMVSNNTYLFMLSSLFYLCILRIS